MTHQQEQTSHVKLTVRSATKARYEDAAQRRRISLVEMAELAIDAWDGLSRDQQDTLLARPKVK